MTKLSNNIRTLRKKNKMTQDFLGSACSVSGAAVSQWEAKTDPTEPETNHLLTMGGLFKVTVEQLVYSDDVENCTTMSTELDNNTLEKVFNLLHQNTLIDKTFSKANIKRKTYMFGLLYALCEDMDDSELAETNGLLAMIGLSSEDENINEPKKKKPTSVTKK